jgi:thymidylate synthase (FAD)
VKEYKVLDHGFVRVIDSMGSDEAVIQAARISYGREDVEGGKGLIQYLTRHRHSTPIEAAVIKLGIRMPIFVARQFVRHRNATINEKSLRYVKAERLYYLPEAYHKASTSSKQGRSDVVVPLSEKYRERVQAHCEFGFALYEDMIEAGVAPEEARQHLPLNTYTDWIWKIDLHNLLHFLKLRTDQTAQHEIREYAKVIEKIVEEWCPVTFAAWAEHVRDAVTFSAKGITALRWVLEGDWRETLDMDLARIGVSAGERREMLEALDG